MVLDWMDRIFIIVYVTNGSNCIIEAVRFILMESVWLICLVLGELDAFQLVHKVFRLDFLVGSVSLQVWFVTPIIVTFTHTRMNHRVLKLINEMKRLREKRQLLPYRNAYISFSWKVLIIELTLSCFVLATTLHHLILVPFKWSFRYVSCILLNEWFLII